MLENHFVQAHSDLVNQVITLPSDLLLPSWQPFIPPDRALPPIPTEIPPGSIIVSSVEGTRTHPKTEVAEAMKSPPVSPKKRSKLKMVQDEDDSSRETPMIIFDDFPKQFDTDGIYTGNILLESVTRSRGPDVDVARPQTMLDPDTYIHGSPPPISIHYDVFARRLEEMERATTKAHVQAAASASRQASKAGNL